MTQLRYALGSIIMSYLKSNKNLKLLKNHKNYRYIFKRYPRFIKLNFSWSNILDNDLKYLKGVHYINLKFCEKITDKGLKYLKGVHSINLRWTNITDKGLKYLKGAHYICLYGNKYNR